MGELLIKLKDAKLLEALEQMAALHRRPVEDEVESLIQRATEDHQRRLELVRRADEIAAMTPKGVKQTDSLKIIHEMREERTRALGG